MQRHYLFLNNTKWYYRLKPKIEDNKTSKGLFSDVLRSSLTSNLIVSLSWFDSKTQKELRLYSYFKSYLEYGIYQMKLPQHERCFYEIILGENAQKPHFDIDISNSEILGDTIRDNLVDAIITVLKDKGIELKLETDILIYTSHGNNKQSYHVIVNNFCHVNNIEAKAFYYKVIQHVKPEYAGYIDSAVYNSLQQFRIVGSQKIGAARIKTFQSTWVYHDREVVYEYPELPDSFEHAFVMQLEASIIGYTGNCKFLPAFEPPADQIKNYSESEDVTVEEAKQAIILVASAGGIKVNDAKFPYKFLGINGPIVMLKRTKPSKCKICERVHEHENPYLIIVGEEKSIFFFCRRDPTGKKLFLGKLNPSGDVPNTEDEKVQNLQINWTKNVIDKVQQLAKTGNSKDKKIITSETPIDKNVKKQLIDMYINTK